MREVLVVLTSAELAAGPVVEALAEALPDGTPVSELPGLLAPTAEGGLVRDAARGRDAVLLVLAAPVTGLRLGFPDAGNDREGTTTRQAYDLLVQGFGAGANGPLMVVAATPEPGDRGRVAALGALADRGWVRGHRRRFHGLELAADPAVRRPQSPAWWWELTALGRAQAPDDG